ncbi:MAG: Ig-like domain repeat protein, partial [Bifidobacteriaceae bacterium]|nr:Ig-like domain repeat protein [Bifidobacteriaceae bacterium]
EPISPAPTTPPPADPALTTQAASLQALSLLAAGATLVPEPTDPGPFDVVELLYDLGDQAVGLEFIGGVKGEFRGKVYYPSNAPEPGKLVVLLHGRHSSCGGSGSNPARYPCLPSQTEIPSYLGYDSTGRALASNGYVVASISANSVNSNDNQLAFDHGATARGGLILDHLDFLAEASAGAVEDLGAALVGKVDFSGIGLMGHSRGGEGVARAAQMNQTRQEPYAITSLLPLAPVDYGRATIPEIPMMTVLPYCDGDVTTLMGQHYADDSTTGFHDEVLRSTVLLGGANHNFFNTVWTPGGFAYGTADDWGSGATGQGANPICGGHASVADTSTRLTAAQQDQVGAILMSAWFRLSVGGEQQFLPLFDGSGGTTASLTALEADVTATASGPASSTTLVNSFETATSAVRPVGSSTIAFCSGMSGTPYQSAAPLCATSLGRAQGPHWTPSRFAWSAQSLAVLKYSWTSANGSALRVDVPASARDVSGRTALTFRAAPGELATAAVDLTVTLRDSAGGTASFDASAYSPALTPLPYNPTAVSGSTNLHKTILREVYVPVSELSGVDLTDLRRIDFVPTVASGTAFLSDLAFSDPALGEATVQTELPLLTMGSTYVNEGAGPSSAPLAIRLSKPTDHPVSGSFEITTNTLLTGSAPTAGQATGQATTMERFTIPAGQVCTTVYAPIDGNRTASAAATAVYPVGATAIQGAATAMSFGTLTIREDDAVVLAGGTVMPLAPEPETADDPCGAPRAVIESRTVVALSAGSVTRGGAASVTATVLGLSSGSGALATGSVSIGVDGVVVGSASISPGGTASFALPQDLGVGGHAVSVEYPGSATLLPSAAAARLVVTEPVPTPVATATVPGPERTVSVPGPERTVAVPGPAAPGDGAAGGSAPGGGAPGGVAPGGVAPPVSDWGSDSAQPSRLSANAKLKALKAAGGKLVPKFNAGKTRYRITATKGTVTLRLTPADAKAKVKVKQSGGTYRSATKATVRLAPGASKTVKVRVIAQNNLVRTYTLVIERPSK